MYDADAAAAAAEIGWVRVYFGLSTLSAEHKSTTSIIWIR